MCASEVQDTTQSVEEAIPAAEDIATNSAQKGTEGVQRTLQALDDPTAQTEVPVRLNGARFPFARFDIETDTGIFEVKNVKVENLSLSQRFMNQANLYNAISNVIGKPLTYVFMHGAPDRIVDWLSTRGINAIR